MSSSAPTAQNANVDSDLNATEVTMTVPAPPPELTAITLDASASPLYHGLSPSTVVEIRASMRDWARKLVDTQGASQQSIATTSENDQSSTDKVSKPEFYGKLTSALKSGVLTPVLATCARKLFGEDSELEDNISLIEANPDLAWALVPMLSLGYALGSDDGYALRELVSDKKAFNSFAYADANRSRHGLGTICAATVGLLWDTKDPETDVGADAASCTNPFRHLACDKRSKQTCLACSSGTSDLQHFGPLARKLEESYRETKDKLHRMAASKKPSEADNSRLQRELKDAKFEFATRLGHLWTGLQDPDKSASMPGDAIEGTDLTVMSDRNPGGLDKTVNFLATLGGLLPTVEEKLDPLFFQVDLMEI